jgi:uncharacterized protein YecT (DUF1311 family)
VERGWVAFKDRDLEFFFDLAKAVKAQSRSYIYIQREYGKQTSYLDFMASPQEREVGFDKDDPIASIRDVAQADRILNNLYQRCLALVPEEKRSEFRQIQLSWIQFNEGFCGFAARLKGGEAQDSVRVQLTLRRAIQFRYYLPVLLAYQLPFNPVSKSISEVVYGEGESKSVDPAIPDVYRFAR